MATSWSARHVVAYHEAGHAVVFALAGATIESVEVDTRRERLGAGAFVLRGRVRLVGYVGCTFLPPGGFDQARYRSLMWKLLARARREYRRQMRAQICGLIAGQVVEHHLRGEITLQALIAGDGWIDPYDFGGPEHEMSLAADLAALLPSRDAYDRCLRATAATLVEHWDYVERLASALLARRDGTLRGRALATLLPGAVRGSRRRGVIQERVRSRGAPAVR